MALPEARRIERAGCLGSDHAPVLLRLRSGADAGAATSSAAHTHSPPDSEAARAAGGASGAGAAERPPELDGASAATGDRDWPSSSQACVGRPHAPAVRADPRAVAAGCVQEPQGAGSGAWSTGAGGR